MISLPSACSSCCYAQRSAPPGAHAWVGPRGDLSTARLIVVGEAPGQEERWESQPFVGPSGRELEKALGGLDDVFVTNARKCLPPEKESSRDLLHSLNLCGSNWLKDELSSCVEARTILCVGADALWQIVGIKAISDTFGGVWNRQEVEAIRAATRQDWMLPLPPKVHSVVACIHPAAAMRGARWMMPTIRNVMSRAKQWSEKEHGPGMAYAICGNLSCKEQEGWLAYDRLAGLDINLNPSPEQLEEALNEAKGQVYAIDVETPRDNQSEILLCGLATSTSRAFVVEWRKPYCDVIGKFLSNNNRAIAGHNFYYDFKSFASNNIRVNAKVYDTITIGSCLWPPVAARKQGETGRKAVKVPWLGLQNSVLRVFNDEAPWKGLEQPWMQAYYQVAYGHRFTPWEWPKLYCALDCLKTRALLEAEREMMERIG